MEDNNLPYLSAAQMVEVDRLMIEGYGIQLVQMMENAGRQLATLAVSRFLGGSPANKKVVVLAGSGGNGGGALVCARNLLNWGAQVEIFLTKSPGEYRGVIRHQVEILEAYRVNFRTVPDLGRMASPEVIIDGVIGYSLVGPPRGPAAELIRWANQNPAPVLALDVPSGVDATTGDAFDPSVRAAATLTLALPKIGLKLAGSRIVGELYLADIGIPPDLYHEPSLSLAVGPIFQGGQIIRLDLG